jgi:hypothetical protein
LRRNTKKQTAAFNRTSNDLGFVYLVRWDSNLGQEQRPQRCVYQNYDRVWGCGACEQQTGCQGIAADFAKLFSMRPAQVACGLDLNGLL